MSTSELLIAASHQGEGQLQNCYLTIQNYCKVTYALNLCSLLLIFG